jgi:dUTP pyrophosphatase
MKVRIINKSKNPLPQYEHIGDAGMDLRADLPGTDPVVCLHSGDTKVIGTGLFVELPEGYEFQIRSRSGLAATTSVFILNSPGTIDENYRNEIKLIVHNCSKQPFIFKQGDRLAQVILKKCYEWEWEEVLKLSATNRNLNYF